MAGTLFVGDMSICCREIHIRELFEEYGKVIRTEIKKNQEAFKFQGYGFVTMATVAEAENAMRNLNGLMVLGRKLRINWANTTDNLKPPISVEVAFSFLSRQIDYMVYEQTIRDLFSYYDCDVLDVRIKSFKIEENKSQQSGVGFVHFPLGYEGVLAAKKVIHHLGNVCFNEIMFDCNMSTTLLEILRRQPELDAVYAPLDSNGNPVHIVNAAHKTRQKCINIDLGFELPYVPLSCFDHIRGRNFVIQQQQQNAMNARKMMMSNGGGGGGMMNNGPNNGYRMPMQQMQQQGGGYNNNGMRGPHGNGGAYGQYGMQQQQQYGQQQQQMGRHNHMGGEDPQMFNQLNHIQRANQQQFHGDQSQQQQQHFIEYDQYGEEQQLEGEGGGFDDQELSADMMPGRNRRQQRQNLRQAQYERKMQTGGKPVSQMQMQYGQQFGQQQQQFNNQFPPQQQQRGYGQQQQQEFVPDFILVKELPTPPVRGAQVNRSPSGYQGSPQTSRHSLGSSDADSFQPYFGEDDQQRLRGGHPHHYQQQQFNDYEPQEDMTMRQATHTGYPDWTPSIAPGRGQQEQLQGYAQQQRASSRSDMAPFARIPSDSSRVSMESDLLDAMHKAPSPTAISYRSSQGRFNSFGEEERDASETLSMLSSDGLTKRRLGGALSQVDYSFGGLDALGSGSALGGGGNINKMFAHQSRLSLDGSGSDREMDALGLDFNSLLFPSGTGSPPQPRKVGGASPQ